MRKLFANPKVRLAGRAVLAGLAVFAAKESSAHFDLSTSVLEAAGTAGVWAAIEAFTPLNALVGVFRQAKAAPAP